MSAPLPPEIRFEDTTAADMPPVTESPTLNDDLTGDPYPPPVMQIPEVKREAFGKWLDEWLSDLISAQKAKIDQISDEELAYRALDEPAKEQPYAGACTTVIPLIAMSVEPVQARLDTGIFKVDRVFRLKAFDNAFKDDIDALEQFVEYNQKHRFKLRRICRPRILEDCKHGTTAFKTIYENIEYEANTWKRENGQWKAVKQKVVRYRGPKVLGLDLQNILFPPRYQELQDCPIVAERQWFTPELLEIAESSKKLTNIKEVKKWWEDTGRTELDKARAESANHGHSTLGANKNDIEIFEVWCDYDINGDGLPESIVATYHRDTKTFLQLRYNWYFHQRKPYTIIPYAVANASLYGVGLAEMVRSFQAGATDWWQAGVDNGYLEMIRMWARKKQTGAEADAQMVATAGKNIWLDDPDRDIKELRLGGGAANQANAFLQSVFGLAEKRTGVSDYLTGRESPIVGSRATATSTMALINEGTKRVEHTMDNWRDGLTEIMMLCFLIWLQYGTDGLEDRIFDDATAKKIRHFFDNVDFDRIYGAIGIELSATDAANNTTVKQQLQLAIISTMMGYYEKLIESAQLAIQAAQSGQESLSRFLGEVADAARKLFKDLLVQYNVPNPEEYLPDLEKYLAAASATAAAMAGGAGGAAPGDAGGGIPIGGMAPPNLAAFAGAAPGGASLPAAPAGANGNGSAPR